MPVSKDLQTIVGRIGEHIAGGKKYGRTEMGRLQRELRMIAEEAQTAEAATVRDQMTFAELVIGLDKKVLDRRALIQRARERHSGGNAAELQAVAS